MAWSCFPEQKLEQLVRWRQRGSGDGGRWSTMPLLAGRRSRHRGGDGHPDRHRTTADLGDPGDRSSKPCSRPSLAAARWPRCGQNLAWAVRLHLVMLPLRPTGLLN